MRWRDAVASWTDGHFNPVIFHAAYGFGKTHLLNALAWEAMRTAPDKKVVYLTAERFLSSFVRALMERQAARPSRKSCASADLLLIDDVHFIGGKQSTEEELFHTLAALMEDGRRVVFSADRPPAALTEMDARLRSHLRRVSSAASSRPTGRSASAFSRASGDCSAISRVSAR